MPPVPPRNRAIPLDPDAFMFLIPLAVAGCVGAVWGWVWLWAPCAALAIAVAGFFRDPPRRIPTDANAFVSPADGKIVAIGPNDDPEKGPVPGTKITIFLSVLNCHVNRAPCEGKVVGVVHKPGKFLNALDETSTDANECNWLFLETRFGRVSVRQIAGLIARRIVCRVGEGAALARGERFGLIRFGSRTELYLPEGVEVLAKVGDRPKGGVTVLARMPQA